MKVEQASTDSLIPYARNPRRNQAAISKVAASIKEFGFRQPVVVDSDYVVVVGHTRLEAAKILGLNEVPVHVAKDMTPAQAKAYRLADNRTGEDATWDFELLTLEIDDLREQFNGDLSAIGFDEGELENLSTSEPEEAPEDFDEYDENIETAHTCPKCGYSWSGKS